MNDTPHSIALGSSIGMFIGWTPTVGIQMVLVMVFAFLTRPFFRFNRIAGLVGVYVSNPVTTVPMYFLMYKVGAVFVGGRATYQRFVEILEYDSFSGWWATVTALLFDVGWPLMIGSLVLGTICAVLTYPVMRFLLAGRRSVNVDADGAGNDDAVGTPSEPGPPTADLSETGRVTAITAETRPTVEPVTEQRVAEQHVAERTTV